MIHWQLCANHISIYTYSRICK